MIKLRVAVSTICLSLFLTGTVSAKTWSYKHGDMQDHRQATVIIPDRFEGGEAKHPVVFVYHGPGEVASTLEYRANLKQLADHYGYILVMPEGRPREGYKGLYWNVAPFSVDEDPSELNDADFTEFLLKELGGRGIVDESRVFALGYSMGGMFAYQAACRLSHRFAGIASIGGPDTTDFCAPSHPVSVLHVHGMDDDRVPYYGGQVSEGVGPVWPSAFTSIQKWQDRAQCKPPLPISGHGQQFCLSSDCTDGSTVEICSIPNMGHTWPAPSKETKRTLNQEEYEAALAEGVELRGTVSLPSDEGDDVEMVKYYNVTFPSKNAFGIDAGVKAFEFFGGIQPREPSEPLYEIISEETLP